MLKRVSVLTLAMVFVLGGLAFAQTTNYTQSYTATVRTTIDSKLAVGLGIEGDLVSFIEAGENRWNEVDWSTGDEFGDFWQYDENNPGNVGTIDVEVMDRYGDPYTGDQFVPQSPMGLIALIWSNKPVQLTIDKPPLVFEHSGSSEIVNAQTEIKFATTPFHEAPVTVETDAGNVTLEPFRYYHMFSNPINTITYVSDQTPSADNLITYDLGIHGEGVGFVIPFYTSYMDDFGGATSDRDYWIAYPAGSYEADWTVTVAQQSF